MRRPQPALRSRILLVESNAIIGLDLAEELEACGYQVFGPLADATALERLTGTTPDIAVLDADLRTGASVDLARELRARGVPMLIVSCHDQKHALPEFRDLPWILLPAPFAALHAALEHLMLRRGKVVVPGNGPVNRSPATGAPPTRVRSSKAA